MLSTAILRRLPLLKSGRIPALKSFPARSQLLTTWLSGGCWVKWTGYCWIWASLRHNWMKPERGFSFMQDGPLDMRMDPLHGEGAADQLAYADADEIAWVLRTYGEERFTNRIARAIVADRVTTPYTRTRQLADMISRVVPIKEKHKHPATRSFQALRIHVNQELKEIEQTLQASLSVLAPGGRLAVISFHSLEDRLVK